MEIRAEKVYRQAGADASVTAIRATSTSSVYVPLVTLTAPPQFGSTSPQVNNFGTAVVIPVPAGVAANDVIIAVLYVQGSQTVTLPTGFAYAPNSPTNMGGVIYEHVFWKRTTTTDGGTYTFTLSSGAPFAGAAERYTGCVSTGNPFDVTTSAAVQASAYPNVSLTTTVPNTTLVWAAIGWDGTAHPPGVTTPPSNMTTRLNDSTGETVAISDRIQVSAGLSPTFSASSTGSDKKCVWLGALIGGVPVPPPPPPPPPEGGLVLAGLYSWGEVATYQTQIATLNEPFHRMGGGMPSDAQYAAAIALNMKVMFTVQPLSFTPSAQPTVTNTLACIDQVLNRFGPGGTYFTQNPSSPNRPIESIEVLNEPNFYGTSGAAYAPILVAAYPHIKANWPTVTVVGFGVGDASVQGPGYIDQVYAANPAAFQSMDVFSFHPYTVGGPPDQLVVESWGSWRMDTHIASLRSQLAGYGLPAGTPFWITEIGWGIAPGATNVGGAFSNGGSLTLTQQAAYNLRMDLLCARQGIARISHMFTTDSDGSNTGYFFSNGPYGSPTGVVRPSALALKQFIALLSGSTSLTVISENYAGGNPFVYKFATPTATVQAAWAQTPQTTAIALPTGTTTTVTDMLGNTITTTTATSYSAALSETPIWLKSV